jgi:hypothetical protein
VLPFLLSRLVLMAISHSRLLRKNARVLCGVSGKKKNVAKPTGTVMHYIYGVSTLVERGLFWLVLLHKRYKASASLRDRGVHHETCRLPLADGFNKSISTTSI